MTAACHACEATAARPHCGAYQLTCLPCCTRLVLSAHPAQHQMQGMLAAIERQPGAPKREDVLVAVELAL